MFVSDIQSANLTVSGIFFVMEKNLLETRKGEPYLALHLYDRTGGIEARVWDRAVEFSRYFEKGDYVQVEGISHIFNSRIQVRVTSIESIPQSGVDIAEFLPRTRFCVDEMWRDLKQCSRNIKDKELRGLVRAILEDQWIQNGMKNAPAGKRMHHAYIGGLLEHTLSVTRLARLVSRHYPWLDADLLLTGAILHDVGKIEEFSFDSPPIDYTDKGRLVGHLVLGVDIVKRFLVLTGMDKESEKSRLLIHIILSHHGQKEFGSPVLPMTEEALCLHYIDDLDAKLNFLQGLKEPLKEEQGYNWTEYQRLLERPFLLQGARYPELDEPEQKDATQDQSDVHTGQKGFWE